jgi:hypothetical protein
MEGGQQGGVNKGKNNKIKRKGLLGWVADALGRGQAERGLTWRAVGEATRHEGRGQRALVTQGHAA